MEKLLKKSLRFANSIIAITQEDNKLIHHSRKSLLFNNENCWVKKGGKLFDVTMGAYDGAEVCELVGCFILAEISKKYDKNNIGLYRDDGLAIFRNINGQTSEKIKKEFHKLFKSFDLEIVALCNLKSVDYLDVTLNLETGTYKPYRKPDNEVNYVHVHSNHPPNVIKQIPLSIQTRLSNLSSNEQIFQESLPYYQEALKRSGYNHKFTYSKSTNHQSKNRKRKIIWFNPPYNVNVATNIGRIFLNLIKKYFPRNHKFHKIFNKNTMKVSYSCMPNIKSSINAHNRKILQPKPLQNQITTCNCNVKPNCPLNQRCLDSNLVYQATINADIPNYQPTKYIGLSEPAFKKRHAVHKSNIKYEKYRNCTTLSLECWRIKDKGGNPKLSWKKIGHAPAYSVETKRCLLCLREKFEIANYPGKDLVNKRSEIIAKCRHRKKFELIGLNCT